MDHSQERLCYEKHDCVLPQGCTGSIRNSQAYNMSGPGIDRKEMFQERENFLGDAGYPVSKTLIPGYQVSRDVAFTLEQNAFDKHHRDARFKIDYAIGLLMFKFQSLHSLNVKIKEMSDVD